MSSEQDRPNSPQRRHVRRTRPRRGGQSTAPPAPAAETAAPVEEQIAPPPAPPAVEEAWLEDPIDDETFYDELPPEPERDWLPAGLALMVMIGLLICAGAVLIAAGKN